MKEPRLKNSTPVGDKLTLSDKQPKLSQGPWTMTEGGIIVDALERPIAQLYNPEKSEGVQKDDWEPEAAVNGWAVTQLMSLADEGASRDRVPVLEFIVRTARKTYDFIDKMSGQKPSSLRLGSAATGRDRR